METKIYLTKRLKYGILLITILLNLIGTNFEKASAAPSFAPPVNDDFDSAILISTPFSATVSDVPNSATPTASFTPNPYDDPLISCINGNGLATIWYKYIATVEGILTVDTKNSGYDTVVAVWTGTRGSLNLTACNDDWNGTLQAISQAHVFPGNTYYIEITQIGLTQKTSVDGNVQSQAITPNELVLSIDFSTPTINVYDDNDSAWTYSSGWTSYTGSGPYNNTDHYTNIANSYAQLNFSGTRVILKYTKHSTYGMMDIYIDNIKYSINLNNPTLIWQATWDSSTAGITLAPGSVHTLKIQNPGGGTYIDIDSLQVYGGSQSILPGTYDNTYGGWSYTGSWTTYNGGGPYLNTLQYTSGIGSSASIFFDGVKFSLTYTQSPNYGLIDVIVDGVKVGQVNAQGSGTWQKLWQSPLLSPGAHQVTFKHAGGGTYIDIDAITTFSTPKYLQPGIYDDTSPDFTYSSGWLSYKGGGPYLNTVNYTSIPGSYVEILFKGTKVKLTYTKASTYGSIGVNIDNGSYTTTINANGTTTWQSTWTSPVLADGNHKIRFTHNGGGTYIDIDAITVIGVPQPIGAGSYDDTNSAWDFVGTGWTSYNGAGPYNNTLKYTSQIGDYAELLFSGTQFSLTYTQSTNYGLISVIIDNQSPLTINAKGTTAWQTVWTSPTLTNGNHTVRFVHGGGGTYIDIDKFKVIQPVGSGIYDDASNPVDYIGTWTSYNGSGPYNNTIKYTSTIGSYAQLLFTGTQVKLTFTKSTNYGLIDVYIDGVYNTTINANGPLAWQSTWTSSVLSAGNHTVQFKYAGGGAYIDIDAIQILP